MSTVYEGVEWVWADGRLVRWEDATLHVMSHVVHYGSSVFEGIRCYRTPDGPRFFRLADHLRRLRTSAKIHGMLVPFDLEALTRASGAVLDANGLEDAYLRPVVFRGVGAAGLDPANSPVHVFLVAWEWGSYLGEESLARGVRCCVSSWFRPGPNTHPMMAKAGGNYLSGSLMKMEARSRGFDEAIALSPGGYLSEGSGQNLFLVMDGVLHTPAVDGTFLIGITRDSIIRLARDRGYEVREGLLPREMLHAADEAFLVGTASEVVPIRSVENIEVGDGARGPVTRALQTAFMELVRGA